MKKNNKKGFTLAELLIVIAIIAVLVAIAIPVFSASLQDANDAVNDANERAVKAMVSVDVLEGELEENDEVTYYVDGNGDLVLATGDVPTDAEHVYTATVGAGDKVTVETTK